MPGESASAPAQPRRGGIVVEAKRKEISSSVGAAYSAPTGLEVKRDDGYRDVAPTVLKTGLSWLPR
jgi:hypothetical protein